TDGVEVVNFVALGGADSIVVNDLSGTDVKQVNLDLAATAGSGTGDNAADTVTVTGTAADDQIQVAGGTAGVAVTGLPAKVTIVGSEGANDQLIVNAGGGNDVVNASGLAAGAIQLTLNGGADNDLLIGSQGNDLVVGGTGNDAALMGAGDDT